MVSILKLELQLARMVVKGYYISIDNDLPQRKKTGAEGKEGIIANGLDQRGNFQDTHRGIRLTMTGDRRTTMTQQKQSRKKLWNKSLQNVRVVRGYHVDEQSEEGESCNICGKLT